MADTVINNAPIRFGTGGVLRIIDGATSYTPNYLKEGSIRVTVGMQNKHQVNDRENLPAPIAGAKNLSRVAFRVRCGQLDATGLMAILSNQIKASPDAYIKEFTVQLDIPNYQGASAGKRLPFTNCAVVPGSLQWEEGTEYDEIAWEMDSRDHAPAWTTF